MDRIVDYLSTYAASLTFDDLPDHVVRQTKRMIVDSIGCALGGYPSEPARIARELAGTVSSTRPATILGSGQSTSPEMAAFADGVMIRHLDYNDGYTGKDPGHPSDNLAAVLPLAEVVHASGKDVITATVLAYEVFCRMCDAVSVMSRGFDYVTTGVISSGLAASKILGLSKEHTAQTLNLCVAPNAALYQTRVGDVSMWKGCAHANASKNAVFAALLAERGLTGPSPIFEGPGGFFNAISGDEFTFSPFAGAGEAYKIMECSIKHFPLGLYAQTVVEAALDVRQKLNGVDDIEEVHVRTLKRAVDIMAGDEDKWRPPNRETADHSIPYTVAVALMHGPVEARHFEDEYLDDPKLLDLVRKVVVSESEEANSRAPEALLSTVEIVTSFGERLSSPEVPYHRGHWKNPMTDQEVEDKFRSLARDVLSPEQTERLLDRLWDLDEVDDIGRVIELVRVG